MGFKESIDKKKKEVGTNEFIMDNLRRDSYGNVEEILCWKCSSPVAGYKDISEETRIVNGIPKIIVKQRFICYANCSTAFFILEDGSKYEPIFCITCVKNLKKEDGDKCLVRDAELYSKQSIDEKMLEQFANKKSKEIRSK